MCALTTVVPVDADAHCCCIPISAAQMLMKDRSSVTVVQGASWASSPWTLQPQIRSEPYSAVVTLHWLLFAAPADYLITIEPPRSCGLQTTVMHRFRSSASVFLPPSPWAWIDPGVFALFGAGAFMGGTTRLTIALAVIMMEVWVALLGHALLLVLAHALFKVWILRKQLVSRAGLTQNMPLLLLHVRCRCRTMCGCCCRCWLPSWWPSGWQTPLRTACTTGSCM